MLDFRQFDRAVENECRFSWMVTGMQFICEMLLIAMWNCNKYMSKTQFKEFYNALTKELNENVNEYLNTITKNPKKAQELSDLAISHTDTVRKELGFPTNKNFVKIKVPNMVTKNE